MFENSTPLRWGATVLLLLALAVPAAPQDGTATGEAAQQASGEKATAQQAAADKMAAASAATSGVRELLRVHAHTLEHRSTSEVVAFLRPLLSERGTVEEQPATRTLVIRDTHAVIERVLPLLAALDLPPRDLRFDIQVLRAARRPAGAEPAPAQSDEGLSEALVGKLRRLLRYDDYEVLAEAGLSTLEGESVTYDLGEHYRVSFKPGAVLAGKRLRLEGFRVEKAIPNPVNKSRRLEPRELFHATLNLWLDRPLTLVLAQDEARREALVVAITCRPGGLHPAVETLDAEPFEER